MCVVLFVSSLDSLGCCLQLFSLVALGQLSVKSLFSVLVGFRCERVNMWWCYSIVLRSSLGCLNWLVCMALWEEVSIVDHKCD